jgi:hypothetical protein
LTSADSRLGDRAECLNSQPSTLNHFICQHPGLSVSIAPELQTGNVDMKDYVLKEKPEPLEMVWAFDLGTLSASNIVTRSREREMPFAHQMGEGGAAG